MGGELVVAGGNAAEVLEAAEGCLDAPAVFVAGCVMADWVLAGAAARDDGHRSGRAEVAPQRVGVIATVGNKPLAAQIPRVVAVLLQYGTVQQFL